jgi:hypothetical protein
MGLKANGRQLHSLPLRARGGSVISFEFPECNKSSLRNIFAGQAGIPQNAGTPQGHLYPSAWVYPQKAGSLSAFNTILGSSEMTGSGALGRALVAALDGAGILTATGDLVVSAVATLAGQGLLSGNVVAVLNAAADMAGAGNFTGALGAISDALANLTGVGVITITPQAVGTLEADISPFSDLSPQNLATAVWAATATGNTTVGSMGELLFNAGGGSSPSIIAQAVWDALSTNNVTPDSVGVVIKEIQTELAKRLKKTDFLALKD